MPSIFDCIPLLSRREAERDLQEASDRRSVRLSVAQAKIWQRHGDPDDFEQGIYDEVEILLAELELVWCCEVFDEQASVWVPLFLEYAPTQLDQLHAVLLADAEQSLRLDARQIKQLRKHSEQSFNAILEQFRLRAQ